MVNFSEILESKVVQSSLPRENFIDYNRLKEMVEEMIAASDGTPQRKNKLTAFWAEWKNEMQIVKSNLEESSLGASQCCEWTMFGVMLRGFKRKPMNMKRLEELYDAVNLNREGFRKIAKKMEKATGVIDGEQNTRMEIFDEIFRTVMNELETQQYLALGIGGKPRSWLGMFLIALLVVTIIVAAAMQPTLVDACVIFGTVAMFMTAWANAANDIANSVGTSVGAGAMTLTQAVVWGSIAEAVGCMTIGPLVAKKISKGVISIEPFINDSAGEDLSGLFALMMLSVLVGCGATTLLATAYGFPISATHGIIGGLVAVALLAAPYTGKLPDDADPRVNWWPKLGTIALGWLAAPAVGGLFAFLCYMLIHKTVFQASDPKKRAQQSQPFYLWLCISVNVLFLFIKGPKEVKVHPFGLAVAMAMAVGLAATVVVKGIQRVFFPPKADASTSSYASTPQTTDPVSDEDEGDEVRDDARFKEYKRNSITRQDTPIFEKQFNFKTYRPSVPEGIVLKTPIQEQIEKAMVLKKEQSMEIPEWKKDKETAQVEQPFVSLLIVSALSVAFAHGGNDVGNAVGPFATILEIQSTGKVQAVPDIPTWALVLGTIGFFVGIWTMGRLTISTVGSKITTLTPTKSFATQVGAAVAVLSSSALGLPVSTSHCLVGSVVGIGIAQKITGTGSLNMAVLKRIFLAWAVTIPLAMLTACAVFVPIAAAIGF